MEEGCGIQPPLKQAAGVAESCPSPCKERRECERSCRPLESGGVASQRLQVGLSREFAQGLEHHSLG